MLINITEVLVVQTRPRSTSQSTFPAPWHDEREFKEDELALDLADQLRNAGDTESRVVRRWH